MTAVDPLPKIPANSAGVDIRPVDVSEADAVWALRTRAIKRLCAQHYPREALARWAAAPMPRNFKLVIKRRCFLAAEVNDCLAGFAFLTGEKAEVEGLFVDPSFYRRGVGRSLLAAVEADAAACGVERIGVCAALNAVSFYLCAGYSIVESLCFQHPVGIELDCIHMEHALA